MSNTHPTIKQYRQTLKAYTEMYNKLKDNPDYKQVYEVLEDNHMNRGLCMYFKKQYKLYTYNLPIFMECKLGLSASVLYAWKSSNPVNGLLTRIEFLKKLIKEFKIKQ